MTYQSKSDEYVIQQEVEPNIFRDRVRDFKEASIAIFHAKSYIIANNLPAKTRVRVIKRTLVDQPTKDTVVWQKPNDWHKPK